jgi:hypothetical protein
MHGNTVVRILSIVCSKSAFGGNTMEKLLSTKTVETNIWEVNYTDEASFRTRMNNTGYKCESLVKYFRDYNEIILFRCTKEI